MYSSVCLCRICFSCWFTDGCIIKGMNKTLAYLRYLLYQPRVAYFQKLMSGVISWSQVARCMLTVSVIRLSLAALDFSELTDVSYDMTIRDVPLGFEQLSLAPPLATSDEDVADLLSAIKKANAEEGSSLVMKSVYGQKFVCSVPAIPTLEREEAIENSEALAIGVVADVVAAAFYVRSCIKKNTGWWTYELCYGKHIAQLHFEGAAAVGGPISLGNYANDSELPNFDPKSRRQFYFEQRYANGTICDLNGKPRSAVVQYTCDELLATNEAFIDEVDERASCSYVVKVRTGSLCKLKQFQPAPKPRSPLNVDCRPVLSEESAVSYVHFIVNKERERLTLQSRVDDLVQRAASLQKQLHVRRRLALISPKVKKIADGIETYVENLIGDYTNTAMELSSQAEGVKANMGIVSAGVNDIGRKWESDAEEDRAYLHWYFKDRHHDRKFFPMSVAYVRARNKYYVLLSEFYSRFDEIFDDTENSYAKFIEDVVSGKISEIDLSLLIGHLPEIFNENDIPGVVTENFEMAVGETWHGNFFTSDELIGHLTSVFRRSLIANLSRGDAIDPDDVMSKCARQIIEIRVLALTARDSLNGVHHDPHTYSFLKAEEIYFQFEKAYNEAVDDLWKSKPELFVTAPEKTSPVLVPFPQRQDGGNGGSISGVRLDYEKLRHIEKVHSWSDERHNEAKGTNIRGRSSAERLHIEKSERTQDEHAAGVRMQKRALRPNVGRKLEKFFRRPPGGDTKKDSKRKLIDADISRSALKLQLQLFSRTLEEQLRETGIADDVDVKVHLITTSNNGMVDGRVNALLEAFLDEQNAVNEEKKRHTTLKNGYLFGAPKGVKDNDEPRSHNPFLPILRRAVA
uniref:MRH domain-containing protein n=1 Tax=Parascaris univalens TaxID=6257 RepID=A0A915C2T7_PARUN